MSRLEMGGRSLAPARFAPVLPHWPGRLEPVALLGDLAVLLGTYALLVFGLDEVTADPMRLALWCLSLVLTWLFVGSRQAYGRILVNPLQSGYVAAKTTLVTGALFYLLPLVGGVNHSRLSSIAVVVVLALAVGAWRITLGNILPASPEELVVVGAGWTGQALADALARRPHAPMRVVAFVDADPAFRGRSIHGVPVYPVSELGALVRRPTGLARVVLANTGHAQAAVFDELTTLAHAGVEVVQMSTLYEQVTGCIPVQYLGSYWWAVLPRPTSDFVYWFGKRTLDVLFSCAGLLVLGLSLPMLWPVLRWQTGGSPFFTQVRVGRDGRCFTLYKLRTLPVESTGAIDWRRRKAANRPTRFCALMRATGLDELPQVINILRGEMSLVGPRPYVPEEVNDLEREIPFFRSRWMVRPGLTGWAQVNYGYGLSLEDEVEKVQHDLYYIAHQSTYLDLLILVRTITNVVRGRRPERQVSLSALPKRSLHLSAHAEDPSKGPATRQGSGA